VGKSATFRVKWLADDSFCPSTVLGGKQKSDALPKRVADFYKDYNKWGNVSHKL